MAKLSDDERARRIARYERLEWKTQGEILREQHRIGGVVSADLHQMRNHLQDYQLRLYLLRHGLDDEED